MFRLTIVLLLAPLFIAGTVRAESFVITPGGENAATFFSESRLESFEGTTHAVRGWIECTPSALEDSIGVEIEVDLASLDTGISLRNQHMRENHLQTDRFPTAVFRGARLMGERPSLLAPHQTARFEIEGVLTLHGVSKPVVAAVEATYVASDPARIDVIARFDVALEDFEISRPKFLFLKLAEVQRVTLEVSAVRGQVPARSGGR